MTECIQSSFEFKAHSSRAVVARFDGGAISSDGGALLLREVNERLGLVRRLAMCFRDGREQARVEHSVEEMLSQRIYGLALGYEDVNDHEQLRHDPMFALLAGRREPERALAGKSTLNRLELGRGAGDRYSRITFDEAAIDELLVSVFLESQADPPAEIVLDLDTTDFTLHGLQEGRFFHGYYDSYCYLPLYVMCGDHVLCARLRQASSDAAADTTAVIGRIVGQIRRAWPAVSIIVRGDSGFCRDELMSWCEDNAVDYVFGFERNPKLLRMIEADLAEARRQCEQTGEPARIFVDIAYQTGAGKGSRKGCWKRTRRVVAKAEYIDGKENPRFVVTSLGAGAWPAGDLYQRLYCGRGDMENRIKEQYSLFADRVSTETMRGNQFRLYLSVMGYVLMSALRRIALKTTELAQAQVATIRTRLLKIGARIWFTARKVWISLSSGYPWQDIFQEVWLHLRT